jgi:citrate synthase
VRRTASSFQLDFSIKIDCIDDRFYSPLRADQPDPGGDLLAGYPVEEIAPRASFEEMLFLLWNDRQPSPDELAGLRRELVARRRVPTRTLELLRSGSRQTLPAMDALRVGVASLALAHPDLRETELQAEPPSANQARALRLVAALPTLAAAHHRLAQGEEPVEPDPGLGHAANYLFMLTGRLPDPAQARALETYLNTTIDHGMNASTFTARVVASTRSDIASAVEAALGALKGPLHGGAPAPALDAVFELRRRSAQEGRSLAEVTEAWARATVGAGGRIMGFGHRVYRVRDPRADVLGAALERLFPRAGENPLYDDAKAVEAVILRVLAEAKPGRRIDTNVEFYTALLLHGLGLPSGVFTASFAVARVGGWTAHVLEQIAEDRLIRPRVAYVGRRDARYVPLEAEGSTGATAPL